MALKMVTYIVNYLLKYRHARAQTPIRCMGACRWEVFAVHPKGVDGEAIARAAVPW